MQELLTVRRFEAQAGVAELLRMKYEDEDDEEEYEDEDDEEEFDDEDEDEWGYDEDD